jgi:hypothetical protein
MRLTTQFDRDSRRTFEACSSGAVDIYTFDCDEKVTPSSAGTSGSNVIGDGDGGAAVASTLDRDLNENFCFGRLPFSCAIRSDRSLSCYIRN